MELKPAQMPRSPVADQSLSGSARSSNAALSAPNQGPALRLESSQTTLGNTSGIQANRPDTYATNADDLKRAENLRNLISDQNMQLTTYHDEASGRSVLEVTDQATGKVVTQYPSDELLRLYAALREPLVDQNA